MATSTQINAIADAIIAAFGGDAAAFQTFLRRSKLETDVAQLDSQIRKQRVAATAANAASEAALQELQAQQATKLAEIDAL